jgi:hypothetical protein
MTQPIPPAPPTSSTPSGKEKKLLEQYRDAIHLKHYSPRTGDTYIHWVTEFFYFHNPQLKMGIVNRHPKEMGATEINQFLTHLASVKKVSASTHTVLAFGARGIRPSAPSSSSTATSSTLAWMKPASTSFAPSAAKTSQRFYPKKKSNVSLKT